LATEIGTREVKVWIEHHEPGESLPSESLILLTLGHNKIAHRPPGRPRRDGAAPGPGPLGVHPLAPGIALGSAAGTLIWPALLAEPIEEVATQLARTTAPPCSSAQTCSTTPTEPSREPTPNTAVVPGEPLRVIWIPAEAPVRREPSDTHARTESQPAGTSSPNAPTSEVARKAALYQMYLGALVGRLMNPGGWVAGARRAGAEPLWTGRPRPYDESTLRKQARTMARRGATDLVARQLESSVEQATAASGAKAVAYTDMFDQVYWTKKPAHAGPIGNRGNRILAATYFGTTFVRPGKDRALAYHLSWHKPASPLRDALEELHGEARRSTWLFRAIRRHIWDRGGCGRPTLRWARSHHIPSLTVDSKTTKWTLYRRAPRVHTRSKIPVFVRRDTFVARGGPRGAVAPEEVIFPAHPDKGPGSTTALRYRTGTPLPKAELRRLDRVYKTRWPYNENVIKELEAVGFDRNLDRGLTRTTSRGIDGELGRVEAREQAVLTKVEASKPTTFAQLKKVICGAFREKATCTARRAAIAATPQDKGARMATGAEPLCKNLMLLMYNALVRVLKRSPLREIRKMTLKRVCELVLGRSLWASQEKDGITAWLDPVPGKSERTLQEELVRLFNEEPLSLRGRRFRMRLSEPPRQALPLRVSA
jgi:hypothetical protein